MHSSSKAKRIAYTAILTLTIAFAVWFFGHSRNTDATVLMPDAYTHALFKQADLDTVRKSVRKGHADQVFDCRLTNHFLPNLVSDINWHYPPVSYMALAIKLDRKDVVCMLLDEKGADMYYMPDDSESAFMTAIRYERWEIAELLLDRGYDICRLNDCQLFLESGEHRHYPDWTIPDNIKTALQNGLSCCAEGGTHESSEPDAPGAYYQLNSPAFGQ